MKNKNIKTITLAALLGLTFLQVSCKKDYVNPNAASESQVFSTPNGLTGAVVGLQRVYTLGRAGNEYNLITINFQIKKNIVTSVFQIMVLVLNNNTVKKYLNFSNAYMAGHNTREPVSDLQS